MNIENMNKYIVEEVYGGKYGEWIDYPKEERERTRRRKYIPIEIFGRKYKLIHQAMEFDYIEPEEKTENDRKLLPRRKSRQLSIKNNKLIEKYFEFAQIEYRNTNAIKIIDNSKIKEMKDEYINYFNTEIKEEVIGVFSNRGIEVENIKVYDDETFMEFDFELLNKIFHVEFDHGYFYKSYKGFPISEFNRYKRLLHFTRMQDVEECMVDDRLDRCKCQDIYLQFYAFKTWQFFQVCL